MSALPPPLPDPAPLVARIRTIPDWPKPGVLFRDITPLLLDPQAFRLLVDTFVIRYMHEKIDRVAGIDARGFIIGSVVAHQLNAGFIPIRKAGKLPFTTLRERYTLEYGEAEVEIHTDAIEPGARALLIDDLIATGGTMVAAANLLTRLGANVVETAAIIDLPALGGSSRLREAGFSVFTLCSF
ncbi:adenine phosphoribosyltransferase [Hydrogenophilus thermoluteolus]|uniref:adenine phosphoribosyltransferase n=1 Tax=Hydrogenophilus thermoluteolus TaxID=297 RepID=UPI0024A0D41C|nr:adenine phosphoribosyltransferase [Hydrogenophilus thermoluteolus]GLW60281.1 adenine phosphoribosyltransferase [Hydrogenophilus thermoluteolus]